MSNLYKYNDFALYLKKLRENINCPNCNDGTRMSAKIPYNRTPGNVHCPVCLHRIDFKGKSKCFECKKVLGDEAPLKIILRKLTKKIYVCKECYKTHVIGEYEDPEHAKITLSDNERKNGGYY